VIKLRMFNSMVSGSTLQSGLKRCRLKIGFFFLLFVLGIGPATPVPAKLRVKLFDASKPYSTVLIKGPFELVSPVRNVFGSGTYQARLKGDRIELKALSNRNTKGISILGSHLVMEPLSQFGLGLSIAMHQMRYYHGLIEMCPGRNIKAPDLSANGIAMTNLIGVPDYIESVVGSETLPDCPPEALKAQAILVLTKLDEMSNSQLSDSTQDQAYFGAKCARGAVKDAVKHVWNERLFYNGRPILVFFHACCAGRTSKGLDVFGKAADASYLASVPCSYCRRSNFWPPKKMQIDSNDFASVFGNELPTIQRRDVALRPTVIRWNKTGKIIEMSGYQFWIKLGQKFGWDKAPGTRFSLCRKPNAIQVTSTGCGHGVGMCQWGAAEQARQGKRYGEILSYYFPGTKIQTLKSNYDLFASHHRVGCLNNARQAPSHPHLLWHTGQ
jgi:stage II sporulation protein D